MDLFAWAFLFLIVCVYVCVLGIDCCVPIAMCLLLNERSVLKNKNDSFSERGNEILFICFHIGKYKQICTRACMCVCVCAQRVCVHVCIHFCSQVSVENRFFVKCTLLCKQDLIVILSWYYNLYNYARNISKYFTSTLQILYAFMTDYF